MKNKKIFFNGSVKNTHLIWKELLKYPPKGYEYFYLDHRMSIDKINPLRKSKFITWAYKNFLYKLLSPIEITEKLSSIPKEADLIYSPEMVINKKIPWVCDLEAAISLAGHSYYLLKKRRKKIEKALASDYCKKIMVFTEFGKRTMVREFDISKFKHKIEVVHFCSNIPKLNKKKDPKFINIIFVGTVNQKDPKIFNLKGGREAIEAFRILSKKYKNVKLKIISNIPKDIDINIDRLEVMPLMDRDNLFGLYASSDIFLAPTYLNLGLSFIEAMGCGLPIVTTDMFGLSEAVDKNGFLINLKKKGSYKDRSIEISEFGSFINFLRRENGQELIEEIVRTISILIENPKMIKKMGLESRKKYEKEFSIKYKQNKLKHIFDEALEITNI